MATDTIQNALWQDYAAPRWSKRKSHELRACFDRDVLKAFANLRGEVESRGGVLMFSPEDLWMYVIGGLERSCEYCGALFGLDTWGIVRRNPLARVQGGAVANANFRLGAYAVCCLECAGGKQYFSDEQWIGLLSALRKCDDSVARNVVSAVGRRYSSGPTGTQVTRRVRNFSSKTVKK